MNKLPLEYPLLAGLRLFLIALRLDERWGEIFPSKSLGWLWDTGLNTYCSYGTMPNRSCSLPLSIQTLAYRAACSVRCGW